MTSRQKRRLKREEKVWPSVYSERERDGKRGRKKRIQTKRKGGKCREQTSGRKRHLGVHEEREPYVTTRKMRFAE